jgi:hypothetical protein
MNSPSLDFLCDSLVVALLAHYRVKRAPVPVRDMLVNPPPDLRRDISLTDVSFGEAIWLRLIGGQGSIFANENLPEPERRYHMACALFTALCATRGGQAVGLPEVPNDELKAQMDQFARRLLLAPEVLPADWAGLSPAQLAALCCVPVEVATQQLSLSRLADQV